MKKKTTQRERILTYMKRTGDITQLEAVNLGCLRLAAQIFDMKKAGIAIKTEMREVTNRDGSKSRIAAYSLVNPDEICMCELCGKITDELYAYEEHEKLCSHCCRMMELGGEH